MFLFKFASSFFFLICYAPLLFAQADYNKTTIYIVRHAEKDTGDNPTLTADGRQRAGELKRFLKKVKINHIYSTPFRRTEMTADSLKIYKGIDVIQYPAKATWVELTELLKKNNDLGKTVLFIGHSNTVPLLIKMFGVSDYPQVDLPDKAFDDIFIIHFKKGKAIVKHKKYGQPSGPSDAMQKTN